MRAGRRGRAPVARHALPSMDDNANIDIDIVEYEDVVIVSVEGEVDLCAAPLFEESLAIAAATDVPAIVLDLDRVSFMDSAGVHVLLQFSISEQNRDRLTLTRGFRSGSAPAPDHRCPPLPVLRALAGARAERPPADRAPAHHQRLTSGLRARRGRGSRSRSGAWPPRPSPRRGGSSRRCRPVRPVPRSAPRRSSARRRRVGRPAA